MGTDDGTREWAPPTGSKPVLGGPTEVQAPSGHIWEAFWGLGRLRKSPRCQKGISNFLITPLGDVLRWLSRSQNHPEAIRRCFLSSASGGPVRHPQQIQLSAGFGIHGERVWKLISHRYGDPTCISWRALKGRKTVGKSFRKLPTLWLHSYLRAVHYF